MFFKFVELLRRRENDAPSLRGGAQKCGAADVGLFDNFFRRPAARNRLLKRVERHIDEVYARYAKLFQFRCIRIGTKQARVQFARERDHTVAQNRRSHDFRDIAASYPIFIQVLSRPRRAKQCPPRIRKHFPQTHQRRILLVTGK